LIWLEIFPTLCYQTSVVSFGCAGLIKVELSPFFLTYLLFNFGYVGFIKVQLGPGYVWFGFDFLHPSYIQFALLL